MPHSQQGLFVLDVPTFNECAVREAVMNAVRHRDFRHGGSLSVRQYPRRIEIVCPGGFPAGITKDNLSSKQNPRNRRIAEVLAKCGLVERAGQGFDFIYQERIRHSKPLPDVSRTREHFGWAMMNSSAHGASRRPRHPNGRSLNSGRSIRRYGSASRLGLLDGRLQERSS